MRVMELSGNRSNNAGPVNINNLSINGKTEIENVEKLFEKELATRDHLVCHVKCFLLLFKP